MKAFFDEFKKFMLRGNVIDLAVGVIIGGAFQAIVNSLVGDIISPLIGSIANTDLSDQVAVINGVDILWGSFVTAIINFVIMAFVIFLFVKAINKATSIGKKKEEPAAPTTKICYYCKSEIAIDAKRCPCCTSDLTAEEAQA